MAPSCARVHLGSSVVSSKPGAVGNKGSAAGRTGTYRTHCVPGERYTQNSQLDRVILYENIIEQNEIAMILGTDRKHIW